jgi:hypothetical protein
MPIVARSRAPRSLLAAGLAAAVALSGGTLAPAQAREPLRDPPAPPRLRTFMEALATVESGGRYTARNPSSGAHGRYQIMPFNWPAWARIYLGNRRAKPTPRNQDRVAAGKLSDLHGWLGRWDRVAYWWLTGKKGPRPTWSDYATRYVVRVMRGYRLRVASPAAGQAVRVLGDRSEGIVWRGAWRSARHEGYSGDHAHASRQPGARMRVRFTGRAIEVLGPVGPTRGRMAVLVDGRRVGVIDLRAAVFRPRRVLWEARWRTRDTRVVELRVLATPGRPWVAVDRVVVRR